MQEEAFLAPYVVPDLTRRLKERQRLDVADSAADFVDHDVDVRPFHGHHGVLDLVRDVRDHLHRVTEIVTAPLARRSPRSRPCQW